MSTFKRDGVELYYELEGNGPPVALISGFGDHSNCPGGPELRQLLARRHTVLTVDNRGSGQTVVDAKARFTIDDMADDIVAVIDHHRLGPVHTVGISMGGHIAMTLALRHLETVCSQVIVVSSAWQPGNRTPFMLETTRVMTDMGVPLEIQNRVGAIVALGESVFDNTDFMDAWVKAPPDPLAQTRTGYDQQMDSMKRYDIRDRLASITTPTLVIGSSEDVLVPPHYQEEIASAIPGAEIKWYPGGHVFMVLPMYMESFVQDVEAFWDKHS